MSLSFSSLWLTFAMAVPRCGGPLPNEPVEINPVYAVCLSVCMRCCMAQSKSVVARRVSGWFRHTLGRCRSTGPKTLMSIDRLIGGVGAPPRNSCPPTSQHNTRSRRESTDFSPRSPPSPSTIYRTFRFHFDALHRRLSSYRIPVTVRK